LKRVWLKWRGGWCSDSFQQFFDISGLRNRACRSFSDKCARFLLFYSLMISSRVTAIPRHGRYSNCAALACEVLMTHDGVTIPSHNALGSEGV